MKTRKYYHDSYLKCNVMLLADVLEKFRNNSLKNHVLCPSHYLSAPELSWDAMLNITKAKLGITSDPDMYIFLEKGTVGELSYISNRYSKANNKYLKSYDSKQESKHGRSKKSALFYFSSQNCVLQFFPIFFRWFRQQTWEIPLTPIWIQLDAILRNN